MSFELRSCTYTLLAEIWDPRFTRKDVAMTYRLAMESSEETDWKAVNAAIITRWSLSALRWIKNQAHSGRAFAS